MTIRYIFILVLGISSFSLFAQSDSDNLMDKVDAAVDSVLQAEAGKRIVWDFGAMDIGVGAYLADGSFKMPTMYNYLDQRYWRSGHVNLSLAEVKIGLLKTSSMQKLRFVTGIKYSGAYYGFERDINLIEDQASFQEAVVASTKEIKRHRLNAHYVQIPAYIEFKSKPNDPMKSLYLAVGYAHNFRYASNYKVKFEDKEKLKVKDDFNLNPSLGYLDVRLGFGPVNFYVQYGLDNLFVEGNGPNVTPINIGIITN